MPLQYIIGDFKTGNITEANMLPVVKFTDSIETDINAGDMSTLSVSRADLPSDWRTYLKPVEKFVALVDTDSTFATGVIWAGWINKISASVKGTVKIQVTSLREYMATRIITNAYNETLTDPTLGLNFRSTTYQGILNIVIKHCFTAPPRASSSDPRPPVVLGTVDGVYTGTGTLVKYLYSEFPTYSQAADDIRDNISNGEEYRFVARWATSAKNKIVWDVKIGNEAEPHINEAKTTSIVIGDNSWQPTAFKQSASSDNLISRIVSNSKAGKGTEGSDYTSKTSTAGTSILIDSSFNPGVELTAAEMATQLTARLAYNSTLYKEAEFERAYENVVELRAILATLGNMVTFSGLAEASQFGLTMRIVGIKFSASSKTVKISLSPKSARYPRLPKDKDKDLTEKDKYDNSGKGPGGGGGGGGNDPRDPILPSPPPPNTPPIVPVIPPFTPPGDHYVEPPVANPSAYRRFTQKFGAGTFDQVNKNWHKVPDLNSSRFNQTNGELLGINQHNRLMWGEMVSNGEWSDAFVGNSNTLNTTGKPRDKNVYLYSLDVPGSFQSPTEVADEYKKLIGTLDFSRFARMVETPEQFLEGLPARSDFAYRPACYADYNFFCSQDFKTVYIQVMITTSWKWKISEISEYKSYSKCTSRTFKGVRNDKGIIEDWEDLGEIFTYDDPEIDGRAVFFSPAIYEVNGSFKAFGGFSIPEKEDEIINNRYRPAYELKFYRNAFYDVSLAGFNYNPVQPVLPGFGALKLSFTNSDYLKSIQIPLAVTVDYENDSLIVGISRAAQFRSTFFESALTGNSYNFTKIMDTQREKLPTKFSAGWTGTTNVIEDEIYSSAAPIAYGNNYVAVGLGGNNPAAGAKIASDFVNRSIYTIRSRVGFDDAVYGEFLMPAYSTSNPDSMYVAHSSMMQKSNNLGAFTQYNNQSWSNGSGDINVGYQYYLGHKYFMYNDSLYLVADALLDTMDTRPSNPSNFPKASDHFYWITKVALDIPKY